MGCQVDQASAAVCPSFVRVALLYSNVIGSGCVAGEKPFMPARNSYWHRANLLHAGYREFGVALVNGSPFSNGTVTDATYALDFGTRLPPLWR